MPERRVTKSFGPSQMQTSVISSKKAPTKSACRWMSLDEIKNVTLPTSELIVRDASGSPIYIIKLRAYVKFRENGYFLINNLRSYMHFARTPNELSGQESILGLPEDRTWDTGVTELNITSKAHDWVEEEVTLLVDCGYLIVEIINDGMFVALKSISFYQSANRTRKNDVSIRNPYLNAIKKPELLVFATNTSCSLARMKLGQQVPACFPLLIMPIRSRYICQNRILLAGNNSVQLVLDEFEFKRISGLSRNRIDAMRKDQPSQPSQLPMNHIEPLVRSATSDSSLKDVDVDVDNPADVNHNNQMQVSALSSSLSQSTTQKQPKDNFDLEQLRLKRAIHNEELHQTVLQSRQAQHSGSGE